MSEPEPPPPGNPARNRLWGRILLVALGLLVLAYFVPSFFRHA